MRAGGKPAGGLASYWKLSEGLRAPERARLLMEIGQGVPLVWEPGDDDGDHVAREYLNSRVWSIAGGSNEMQRNAISEQILGLPREPSFDKGKPFNEVVHQARNWAQEGGSQCLTRSFSGRPASSPGKRSSASPATPTWNWPARGRTHRTRTAVTSASCSAWPRWACTATTDTDALLATPADCVVFMRNRDWVSDPMGTFPDLLRILRSGKNVVNLWWPSLVYPRPLGDEVYKPLQEACLEGGSSFLTVGMDPGYGTAALALAALPLAREVSSVHMIQIMNNAHWEGEGITLFYGFGQRDPANSPMLAPGVTTRYHATTLHMLADAIGVSIDDIVEDHSVIYADEAFDIASGHIPAGTISGLRYQVKGMAGGEARVIVEHVERLRDERLPRAGVHGRRLPGGGHPAYRPSVSTWPSRRLPDSPATIWPSPPP